MVNLSTKFEVSISKIADLNLPLLYLAPIRVTPFEFQKDLWNQKVRFHELLYGIISLILILAIFIK